jgi:hypothetical protein
MQPSKRDLSTWSIDEESDVSEEAPAASFEERLGISVSLLLLCVGLIILALSFGTQPGFEKCGAVVSSAERLACYDQRSDDLQRPPAKGAIAPAVQSRDTAFTNPS